MNRKAIIARFYLLLDGIDQTYSLRQLFQNFTFEFEIHMISFSIFTDMVPNFNTFLNPDSGDMNIFRYLGYLGLLG
jgi:hypothetical protein